MRQPETMVCGRNGWMPNNPALPVLIYHEVFEQADPDAVEAVFRSNAWRPDWRDGVFAYHHYHSTAHEALACTGGWGELTLGGEGGRRVQLVRGDCLVLPAGTGHCRIGASDDFVVVGAYPNGQDWDICREAADAATRARITAVPMPTGDPVSGACGPLMRLWGG